MSNLNQSSDCNANLPGNEPIEAVNNESALSLQCSNSSEIVPISIDLIDNHDNSKNDVFQNGAFPNDGQKPCYKGEIVKGECSRGDNHRSHVIRHNYYRGVNSYRHNHMQFPRAYCPPLISPPMRPTPFIANVLAPLWSVNQGPLSCQYYVPQAQFYSGTFFVRNYHQDIYAAHQSYFSTLLENLRAKLRKQIEYYFCMENLCSDEYLRRHMDAQGWVPTSLIAGFRKVEQLMKEKQSLYDSFGLCNAATRVDDKQSSSNIQFISDSLRPSLSVEVQSDKVRKRHEWEKWLWPSDNHC